MRSIYLTQDYRARASSSSLTKSIYNRYIHMCFVWRYVFRLFQASPYSQCPVEILVSLARVGCEASNGSIIAGLHHQTAFLACQITANNIVSSGQDVDKFGPLICLMMKPVSNGARYIARIIHHCWHPVTDDPS